MGSAPPPRPFGSRRLPKGNRRSSPSARSRGPRGLPGCTGRPLPKQRTVRPQRCVLSRVFPPRSPRASVAVPRGSSARGASQGFRPLQRSRTEASTHLPRAVHARYVPSPGFRTLLTACSASIPPGLFHPGGALGVRPFRAFPSRGAVAPLGARCLPDVTASDSPRRALRASSRAEPWPVRADPLGDRTEVGASRLRGFAPLESPLPPAAV